MKEGLKVQCPSCKKTNFVTTKQFNPDIRPNGSMIKWTGLYQIDFLETVTTLCSELICPDCQASLAPSGRLTVLVPEIINPDPVPVAEDSKAVDTVDHRWYCVRCDREFKTEAALKSHLKSHKEA